MISCRGYNCSGTAGIWCNTGFNPWYARPMVEQVPWMSFRGGGVVGFAVAVAVGVSTYSNDNSSNANKASKSATIQPGYSVWYYPCNSNPGKSSSYENQCWLNTCMMFMALNLCKMQAILGADIPPWTTFALLLIQMSVWLVLLGQALKRAQRCIFGIALILMIMIIISSGMCKVMALFAQETMNFFVFGHWLRVKGMASIWSLMIAAITRRHLNGSQIKRRKSPALSQQRLLSHHLCPVRVSNHLHRQF